MIRFVDPMVAMKRDAARVNRDDHKNGCPLPLGTLPPLVPLVITPRCIVYSL